MNQMEEFCMKLQNDKAMQEALAQAKVDATIAVAGKYGFTLTESDFKEMSGSLSEEELAAITGGGNYNDDLMKRLLAKIGIKTIF